MNECELCNKKSCHGECDNYILEMALNKGDRSLWDKLFREIPKFNYVLNSKVASIFGTDLQVASKSDEQSDKTKEFNQFLYKNNENGVTNLSEIKKAMREKEIFGISYIFYDDENESLYFLRNDQVSIFKADEDNPIIDDILCYTVGSVEMPDNLNFKNKGFIKQDAGYIINPENMVKFKSDSYILNSDLKQLQILLEINRKIYQSTTKRDYGDIFVLTSESGSNPVSAVAQRIKNTTNDAIKKMRQKIAELIKKNKVEDSNVVILDERHKEVKQIGPITTVKDYKFVWEKQDDIMASVVNFPTILLNLGEASGNISKEALIKDARANFLTPIKTDTENALSAISKKMFGEEYYLRFEDYQKASL